MKAKKSLIKRNLSILKDRERFSNRLRTSTWTNPTSDTAFRLNCLIHFNPAFTNRQIFNLSRINLG